ncbi:RNA chaperone Hfq [Terribacillus saccharophilus]|uniref:RNA chaperone Hfq n=1 Tax=Terribacillus saccharophilus TaxID=361277 RepID=UPI0039824DCF
MSQSVNIQDQYLNQLRKERVQATVFLTNGFQIRGTVKAFDNYTVLIETEGRQQLIFKHAISTFSPVKNVSLDYKEQS